MVNSIVGVEWKEELILQRKRGQGLYRLVLMHIVPEAICKSKAEGVSSDWNLAKGASVCPALDFARRVLRDVFGDENQVLPSPQSFSYDEYPPFRFHASLPYSPFVQKRDFFMYS